MPNWNSNTLATGCEELTHWKDLDAGKDWRQEEKRVTEDEIVGWHHWLNGHEFEQAPGDGEGQGSLACCIPWGRKESDMTEQLNTHNKFSIKSFILGLFMYLKNTIALLLFFLLYWAACGILVSLPCIELDPLTVRAPTVLPGNSHPLIV